MATREKIGAEKIEKVIGRDVEVVVDPTFLLNADEWKKIAEVVCTDTFHGTAFAVNFNKPFYSLGTKYWKQDIRKTTLLKLLRLEERLIDDESDIISIEDYSCDFTEANFILDREREKSILYLQDALEK